MNNIEIKKVMLNSAQYIELPENKPLFLFKSDFVGDSFFMERKTGNIIRLNSYDLVNYNRFEPFRMNKETDLWFISLDVDYEAFVYKSNNSPIEIDKKIKKNASFLIIKSLLFPSSSIWWASCMRWDEYIDGCSYNVIQKSFNIWQNKHHNIHKIYIGTDEKINLNNNFYLLTVFYDAITKYYTDYVEKLFDQYEFIIYKDLENLLSPLYCSFRYKNQIFSFSLNSDKPVFEGINNDNKNRKLIIAY